MTKSEITNSKCAPSDPRQRVTVNCQLTTVNCVLAVIVLAVGLRLAPGLIEPMSTESDSGEYLAMATNLAEGNGLIDKFGNRAYYSPGYPMLLAAVFLLTGPKLGTVLAVNLVLAAVSIFLVYRVARCASGERAGILAALAWAVYVPSMAMANVINKENLMVPLMLGLVWIALAWPASRRRIALAALAGLLAGMLAFTGATGCAVAGAVVIVVLVHGVDWRQRMAAAGAFLLAALVLIGPWVYRNYTVLGTPVLFTNAGFNLYLCHNPEATGWYMSIGDTPMAADWGRIKAEGGEAAADREAARRAFAYMWENPGSTLAMFAKKAVIFWEPPYLTSVEPESLVKRVARYVWFTEYLVLIALALAGLRTIRRTWPLYLAIGLYFAIHVPFVFMLRYRFPIMALLAAGVSCQLTVVSDSLSRITGQTRRSVAATK